MASSLKLEYYKNLLCSMKVAKLRGKINIAKPIMLLTIITLIGEGKIIGNKISFTNDIINTYNEIFLSYRPGNVTRPIYPFYYLKSEEFYYINGNTSRCTPSAKYLRENVEYAVLDDQLWDMLQDANIREELKQTIIKYFLR